MTTRAFNPARNIPDEPAPRRAGWRTVRLLIAAILVLALADVGVRATVRGLVRQPDFRIRAARAALVDELIAFKASTGKPLVVLLGDATAAGAEGLPDSATPAATFTRLISARSGGAVEGLALTLPGARPADYLFLLRRLEGLPVRGLFVALDYAAFSPAQLAVPLADRNVPPTRTRVDGVDVLAQILSPGERAAAALSRGVGSLWAAYRYRAVLADLLLSGGARPTREPLASSRAMYRFDAIDPDAFNVRLLRLFCRYVQEQKIEPVFYVTPIHWDLIHTAGLMEDSWFQQNAAFAQNVPRSFEFETQDLSALVPGDAFLDARQLLPDGNLILAETLVNVAARRGWLGPPMAY